MSTATGAPAPSETVDAPEPTETVDPIVGTAIEIGCEELLSASALDFYGGTFTPVADFTPGVDWRAQLLVDQRGVACLWVDQSTGKSLVLAVANMPHENLETIKNDRFLESNSVPTYGVEGYFMMVDTVGEAEAFDDPYWIYTRSDVYFEPGDALPAVSSAMDALG